MGRSPTKTFGDRRPETRHTYDWDKPRRSKVTDSNPQDPKEERDTTSAVAHGLVFGIIIGTLVFALTQNAFWIGIRSGIGIVVGAAFQANRH
jgi:hypothetical protein